MFFFFGRGRRYDKSPFYLLGPAVVTTNHDLFSSSQAPVTTNRVFFFVLAPAAVTRNRRACMGTPQKAAGAPARKQRFVFLAGAPAFFVNFTACVRTPQKKRVHQLGKKILFS